MSLHTISIFERIYSNLPPLVPDETKKEMEHALEHLKNDTDLSTEETENTLIVFGKKIWPYWKAFNEFVDSFDGQMGEKFFVGKLNNELKQKYKLFKEHGGTYADVYSGGPAFFFGIDERQPMTEALLGADEDLKRYTVQAVLSTDRKKYEDLILDFQTILDDIEKRLDSLRLKADDEQEHPKLADEIRAHVRAFEHGLCLLGPHTRFQDVFEAEGFLEERRKTRVLHR